MIEISLNPLERLGISREMVKRFCAQNGVGVNDLGKLIQTVSRHASSPFHTDRNQTPGADQIFKDIQQAASEVDSEEKLGAAVNNYIGRPASQVEMLREQYAFRLGLLQEKDKELSEAFKNIIVQTAFGNEMFKPSVPQIQRFCVVEPDYTPLLMHDFINFSSAFYSTLDIHQEYFVDDDGNVKKYPLKEYDDCITESKLRHYSPKPNELIISLSVPQEPKDIMSDYSESTEVDHAHYYRTGSSQRLNDLRIVGTLFSSESSFTDSRKNAAFYEVFGLPDSPFVEEAGPDPEERFKNRLSTKNTRSQESVASITEELTEGFTFTRFAPLIQHFSFDFDLRDLLVACKMTGDGPRLLLLGEIRELHEKTRGLFRKNK